MGSDELTLLVIFGYIFITTQMTQTQATQNKSCENAQAMKGKVILKIRTAAYWTRTETIFHFVWTLKSFIWETSCLGPSHRNRSYTQVQWEGPKHIRVLTSCLGPSRCSMSYTQRASFQLISHTCMSSYASRGVQLSVSLVASGSCFDPLNRYIGHTHI